MSKFTIGDTVYIKPEYIEHFSTECNGNLKIDTPYTVYTGSYDDMVSIEGVYNRSYEWRFMSKEEWLKTKDKSIYADGNSPMQGDIVECVVKDDDYEKLVIGKHYTVLSVHYDRTFNRNLVCVDLDEPHLKKVDKWAYKFNLVKRANEMDKFNKATIPVGSIVLAKHKIVSTMDYEGDYETDIGYVNKDAIVEILSEGPFNLEVGDEVWVKGSVRASEPKIVRAIIPTRSGNSYVTQFKDDSPLTYKLNELERW